jgi:hypothetical protein
LDTYSNWHANCDTDQYPDLDTYSDWHANINAYAGNADTSVADIYTVAHGYSHRYAYSYISTDQYPDLDTYSDWHTNCDTDQYANVNADACEAHASAADIYTEADTYIATEATYTHAYASDTVTHASAANTCTDYKADTYIATEATYTHAYASNTVTYTNPYRHTDANATAYIGPIRFAYSWSIRRCFSSFGCSWFRSLYKWVKKRGQANTNAYADAYPHAEAAYTYADTETTNAYTNSEISHPIACSQPFCYSGYLRFGLLAWSA